MRRVGTIAMLMILLSVALLSSEEWEAEEGELAQLRGKVEEAVSWLLEQKVPNGIVESPVPKRRNLLISYRIPEDDPAYPYLKGRAYIYDSALAAIAFTMTGRFQEAEDVLFALSRQLRPDGSLWFGLNLQNEWPSEEGHAGAVIRSGASSWAGYAATYYLRARAAAEPGFSLDGRIARRVLLFAEKVAGHLLSLQIRDTKDPRYGLVTGGNGSYSYSLNDEGEVVTEYDEETIGWVSAEHNIDTYFLFSDLAELTGERRYEQAAEMVETGLLSMWSTEESQIIQGIKREGRRDTVLPLDTSSWGSMFLRAAGHREKADETLNAGLQRFGIEPGKAGGAGSPGAPQKNADPGVPGEFRPYADSEVYQSDGVSRAYFDDPDLRWNELNISWPEGAFGVAAALAKGSRFDDARRVVGANLRHSVDGGIRYASMEVPHQFSTHPSVASTAWLVIAVELLTDENARRLFW